MSEFGIRSSMVYGSNGKRLPEELDTINEQLADITYLAESFNSLQEAIDYASVNGGGKVSLSRKIYTIDSPLILKSTVTLIGNNSIIKPSGDIDVILLKPETNIRNGLVIDTSGVSFTKSAIKMYGGDKFEGYKQNIYENIKLENGSNDLTSFKGVGLEMYCDAIDQMIEFVKFPNLQTRGYGKGVYIHIPPLTYTPPQRGAWINANTFENYTSFRDVYGIYIDGIQIPYEAVANRFVNLQIQPHYGNTINGIYVNSGLNYFSGYVWDFGNTAIGQPETAIRIEGGENNTFDMTYLDIHKPKLIVNKVKSTRFISPYQTYLNLNLPSPSDIPGMYGAQDNYLAYADKRFTVTMPIGTQKSGTFTNLFSVDNITPMVFDATSTLPVTIEIDLTSKPMVRAEHLIVQFAFGQVASSVKIEVQQNGGSYQTVYDVTDNIKDNVIVNRHTTPMPNNIAKIKVTLGGLHSSGRITLQNIMAVDSYNKGHAWVSRDGGKVFGDLEVARYSGFVATTPDGTKRYRIGVDNSGNLTTTLI